VSDSGSVQADKVSEIIRSQIRSFEGNQVPDAEPFKPLPKRRRGYRSPGSNKQDEHHLFFIAVFIFQLQTFSVL